MPRTRDDTDLFWWRVMSRYLVAVGTVVLALLVRLAVAPWLFEKATYMPFFFAVAVTAAVGGVRPGLLATALSVGLSIFFLLPPRYSFRIESPSDVLQVAFFTLMAVGICWLSGSLHRTRRRAERERARLWAEQERFRLAADAVDGIIYECDFATGHVERTRGLSEVLGHQPDEVPPTAAWWAEQIHPDDRERVTAVEPQAGAGRSSVTEYRVRHKDGRWLHVEDRAVLLTGGDGRPVKMVGCTVDVTDRRRAAAELRRRETFISGVLGSITDAFYVVGNDWRFTFVNDEIVRRFGRRREDIIGGHVWEMFPAAVGGEAHAGLHRAMADRVAVEYEVFYEPWGRWFLDKAFPTDDGGLAVYSRDITDHKSHEERLRGSEERQAFLLKLSDAVRPLADPTDIQAAATRLLGERLGVAQAYYVETDTAAGRARVRQCYCRGDSPSLVGDHALADFGWVIPPMQRGEFVVVSDVTTSPLVPDADRLTMAALRIAAHVNTPLVKAGVLVGALCVTEPTPRAWTAAEVGLVHEAGERIWAAVERAKAEASLRESEAKYRTLFKTMVQGYSVAELVRDAGGRAVDYRFIELNPAFERLTGIPVADARGRSAHEVVPGIEDWWVEAFDRIVRRGKPERLEYRVAPLDRWYEAHVYPQGGDQFVALYDDITARKKGEQQLREAEGRFRTMADNSPVLIWQTDAGGVTFVNRHYLDFFGQPLEAVAGMGWADFLHPDDAAGYMAAYRAAFDQRAGYEYQCRFRRHDGEYRWLQNVGTPHFGPDGAFAGFIGCSLDVTDRRRAEEERAERQQTLFTVVERCPFGIYIVDADFRIASVNAGSQDKAFANVRPLIGRPFDEAMRVIWPEPLATDLIGIFRHTLATGEPYHSADFVNPRADTGVTEGYEWELHRIPLPDGRPGVVCYYFDATKLRQAEQQLKEADRRKDEFLATLAHELRNPLAPVRNGLQIMKLAGGDGGTVEKARSMMERQIEQMTRLIEDLMDLSRISRGKIQLQKTRMRLAEAVQNAVDTSRPLIEQMGHELALDGPGEPVFVDGDLTRLSQVFANLLNNAAKYTDRGGRIRLAVRRQGGEAVVSVEDNGVGIPAHMLPRVFDMFTQVDRSLEKAQGGLGIGLNIVKRLVEMHGGAITAESGGHGLGSRFVVRLPVVPATGPTTPGGEEADGIAAPATRRILVVDDNRDGTDSLAMMLRVMGNDTRAAHDGLEAVAAAEAFRPDVILMDIGMPKLNGLDACRRIRAEAWGRDIVIVACTGWGQEEDRRKSQDAGFTFHMVKPVDPAALGKLLAGLHPAGGRP